MKISKIFLMGTFVLSWSAGLLTAAPAPMGEFKISFALPAQTLDLTDLDVRDENNRPIASPQIRRRFEDLLNQSLNRLLIDNLTPLRRAYLDLLGRERDAFGDWLGRVETTVQRVFSTAAVNNGRAALLQEAVTTFVPVAAASSPVRVNEFLGLVFLLIASTRLIC